MPKADGSVIIKASTDISKAESDLAKLKKEIEKTEAEIYEGEQRKAPLEKKLEDISRKADIAAEKLYQMKNAPAGTYSSEEIKMQEETLRGHQAHWEMINREIRDINKQAAKLNANLTKQKNKAGELAKKTSAVSKATAKMAQAQEQATKSVDRFGRRLKAVVRSALVFTLITKALSSLREWFGKVIKTDEKAVEAIAQLKGALLTLAQPLIEVIIPAFTKFVNILTYAVAALSRIVSALFGKTAEESAKAAESLYEETEAMEELEDSAKKATKALASFDEINQLASETASDVSGETITPKFDAYNNLPEWLDSWVTEVEAKIKDFRFTLSDEGERNGQINWKAFLAPALGAVIGAMFGGLPGGMIGLALGTIVSLLSMEFAGDEFNEADAKASFKVAIAGLLGLIIGSAFGGFWGGVLGLVIGLSIGFGMATFDDEMSEAAKKIAQNGLTATMTALLGVIFGAAFGGLPGGIIGGIIGLTFGLAISWSWAEVSDKVPNFKGIGPDYSWMFTAEATASIPALATGSVIPPNREFLAVLGDNKTETEVVSPLSTIEQAVENVLSRNGGGGGGTYTFVVNLDGEEVARTTVRHINQMTERTGETPLLI